MKTLEIKDSENKNVVIKINRVEPIKHSDGAYIAHWNDDCGPCSAQCERIAKGKYREI